MPDFDERRTLPQKVGGPSESLLAPFRPHGEILFSNLRVRLRDRPHRVGGPLWVTKKLLVTRGWPEPHHRNVCRWCGEFIVAAHGPRRLYWRHMPRRSEKRFLTNAGRQPLFLPGQLDG